MQVRQSQSEVYEDREIHLRARRTYCVRVSGCTQTVKGIHLPVGYDVHTKQSPNKWMNVVKSLPMRTHIDSPSSLVPSSSHVHTFADSFSPRSLDSSFFRSARSFLRFFVQPTTERNQLHSGRRSLLSNTFRFSTSGIVAATAHRTHFRSSQISVE